MAAGHVSDGTGRKVAEKTVVATSAGHFELVCWVGRFLDHCWALEDCRHLSRRLLNDLLVAGEAVVRVPPKLMAGARRSARQHGKSDPIDALAVARAALGEDLPVATLDGPDREIRLLVDNREDLVAERTRAQNRLRWHLHELDAWNEPPARSLERAVVLATAGIDRFRSRGAFARHDGTAPHPVWSNNTERPRLSRTGNCQLNVAIHRIAITQLQREGPGMTYLEHHCAQGDTKIEAIRALRRRISDEVFRRMRHDEAARVAGPAGLAATA